MKVFIDGLIFGRQKWGGISRMWEEYLVRLPKYVSKLKLLIPFRYTNQSLSKILEHKENFQVATDYFYWPIRYFERIPVRSKILRFLHVDDSIDVFHSTFFSTLYKKNIKKIVTVHDMIPELFQKELADKWNDLEIIKKRKTLKNADKIIAVSQNTRKDLLRFYPWIPGDKIEVIHHGLLPGKDNHVSLNEICQKYSLDIEQGNYFLYVGNRNIYKNFQILATLVEKKPKYREALFLCVGGGKANQTIKILEEKNQVKNFIFLDYVSDDELAALYRNALALVFPSKYEGFGLPVLEAMAHECPVVCSDVSSLPEVGGDAAFYFDPDSIESLDDALKRLSKTDRNEVVCKGKQNTHRFSWERSTKNLIKIYKEIISA